MNNSIRVFSKTTNRRTLDVPLFGASEFTSQKEFLDLMKLIWNATKENPELLQEFKIQNQNYDTNVNRIKNPFAEKG